MHEPLCVSGLRIWDGVSESISSETVALRIEDGRIAGIGPSRSLRAGAEVVDLDGATALPGLIDAHVHLCLDPGLSPAENAEIPAAERDPAMAARAASMLAAGITTARDLGGPDGGELRLRDRIAQGEVVGPRLLCAGQPVTTPRGHCWFWGGEAASPDEIRAVVARQVRSGADWIKVMATGGVITQGTSPGASQFDRAELETVVAAAADAGLPVAAHCHGTRGIADAAAAGVRTVEHCSFAGDRGFGDAPDAGVAAQLGRAPLWVSPTVNAGWQRFLAPDAPEPAARFAVRMKRVFADLRAAGARLVASTDAGIPRVAHDRLPEALAVFASIAGLSPVEALRSATSESARALGLETETGALRAGLAADVLVVDGDPLRDLGALRRPRLVLARGRRSASTASEPQSVIGSGQSRVAVRIRRRGG